MSDEPLIVADRVEEILIDCLFKYQEDHTDHVEAEGILTTFYFHPGRLETNAAEIREMLLQLPQTFMQSDSGGWSFLNACVDKNGAQWTGLRLRTDQLFSLGQAIGFVECVLPREAWKALPGGMPYYVVLDKQEATA